VCSHKVYSHKVYNYKVYVWQSLYIRKSMLYKVPSKEK
jgi:hypothetical protein